KIPVSPQYLISQSPDRVVLRNFEGGLYTYTQPKHAIDPEQPCSLCGGKHNEEAYGVSRMLAGKVVAMEPAEKE
ncbi:MAG: lysine 2,3-aminomutase, partial [Firmicutes bacterium]|nr:lysine 2,3-aminomutase [Bacillota bacterium]